MASVRVEDGAIVVESDGGGAPVRVPLFSGEMHYWRLNSARWEAILARFAQLGIGMVATYVPWEYHELGPGVFDFDGRTEGARNLVGFLRAAGRAGLWVFIRPGPFIYAEWKNAGVPDRVVRMPRLSEEYRNEARVWMEAVVGAIKPHFATAGAAVSRECPVVLFQPDNEMDLFSHWFESECGLDGSAAGYFHEFLQEVYGGDIAALNRAWGSEYRAIEEARAFAEPTDTGDASSRARARDYRRFQHWAVTRALKWHVDEYRRLGVDLPMVANYYPGGDVQNWRDIAAGAGVDFLGIDWYPRNEFGAGCGSDGRDARPTGGEGGGLGGSSEDEHRRFLDTCRCQRVYSKAPYIAEFECGVWHGYHEYVGVPSENHYRLMACSALLAGIVGWNWYMLVGRDNWYYAAVNERGEPRPEVAGPIMEVMRVVRDLQPAGLEKLTSAAVLLDAAQFGTDRIMTENPVLRAVYAARIDFEVMDAEVDSALGGGHAKPLLFYACEDWLPAASQTRLISYMEAGGTLVLFRQRPLRDERFEAVNQLGIVKPDGVLSRLGKKVSVEVGRASRPPPGAADAQVPSEPPRQEQHPLAEGAVWWWDERSLPPGAEPIWCTQVAGAQQPIENADAWMNNYRGKRWVCGYVERRGRGRLVVMGLEANGGLVRAMHRLAGVPIYSSTDSERVHTALFRRGGELFLVATNMGAEAQRSLVELEGVGSAGRGWRVQDLWKQVEEDAAAGAVTVRLGARSGGAFRIVPA